MIGVIVLCPKEMDAAVKPPKLLIYQPNAKNEEDATVAAKALVRNTLANEDEDLKNFLVDKLQETSVAVFVLHVSPDTEHVANRLSISLKNSNELGSFVKDHKVRDIAIHQTYVCDNVNQKLVEDLHKRFSNLQFLDKIGRDCRIGICLKESFPITANNPVTTIANGEGLVYTGDLPTATSTIKFHLHFDENGTYDKYVNQIEPVLTAWLDHQVEKCKKYMNWDKVVLFSIDRSETFVPLRCTAYRVDLRYEHSNELYDLGFVFYYDPKGLNLKSNDRLLVDAIEEKFNDLISRIQQLDERDNQ